jgi:hypothetical protein
MAHDHYWYCAFARKAALAFTAALLPNMATAAISEINPTQPRELTIVVEDTLDNRVPANNRRYAQKLCVNHFFGPDAIPTVAGSGSFFFGRVHFLTDQVGVESSARTVAGPSFGIQGGARFRLTDPTCSDPDGSNANNIPMKRKVMLLDEDNGHFLLDTFLGATVLSLSDVGGLSNVSISGNFTAYVGITRSWVWWSDPSNFISRKELSLGLGALAGFGASPLEKRTTSPEGVETVSQVVVPTTVYGLTFLFTWKL